MNSLSRSTERTRHAHNSVNLRSNLNTLLNQQIYNYLIICCIDPLHTVSVFLLFFSFFPFVLFSFLFFLSIFFVLLALSRFLKYTTHGVPNNKFTLSEAKRP